MIDPPVVKDSPERSPSSHNFLTKGGKKGPPYSGEHVTLSVSGVSALGASSSSAPGASIGCQA